MQGFEIVIDAQTPSRLAAFWAAALPSYRVRAYDAPEMARLAAIGLTPATDTSVAIDGDGPTIWFQHRSEPTAHRNRLHFDLKFAGRASERERLLNLGATLREERDDHTVMLDPEGNQFCVFAAPHALTPIPLIAGVTAVGTGSLRQITVKRDIAAKIDTVWRALTRADEIQHWWATGEIDAHVGGRIRLGGREAPCEPGAGPPLDGSIKLFVPPHLFAFVWHVDYPEAGLVRFDLIERGADSTQTTLVQNVPRADTLGAAADGMSCSNDWMCTQPRSNRHSMIQLDSTN
ncbi:MAG: hypothetical protein HC809_03060 [Gammaproteobacteria bacterium]|nr:hypothetical protein [Gammaproteobacteria bacterium]